MTDFFELVSDFNLKFGFPRGLDRTPWCKLRNIESHAQIIQEEAAELAEAIKGEQLAPIVKEACDLLYATFGLFVHLGIRPESYFREVHASNMSKTPQKGRPSGGKPSKEGYSPADMNRILGEEPGNLAVRLGVMLLGVEGHDQ